MASAAHKICNVLSIKIFFSSPLDSGSAREKKSEKMHPIIYFLLINNNFGNKKKSCAILSLYSPRLSACHSSGKSQKAFFLSCKTFFLFLFFLRKKVTTHGLQTTNVYARPIFTFTVVLFSPSRLEALLHTDQRRINLSFFLALFSRARSCL